MTRKDIDDIINTICPNDEDFEKACISPAYLKKELEALALEQEPCEDCVSRTELKKWLDMNFSFGGATRKLELFDRLDKELPPVKPKSKSGKWIRNKDGSTSYCSECGQQIYSCQEWFKCCPNCEAKMKKR